MAYGLLAKAWLFNAAKGEPPIFVGEFHCCRTNLEGNNVDLIIEQANETFGKGGWDRLTFLITSSLDAEIENPAKAK